MKIRKKFPMILDWNFKPYAKKRVSFQDDLIKNEFPMSDKAKFHENTFRCDYCFDTTSSRENRLVVCELCMSAVHRNCHM